MFRSFAEIIAAARGMNRVKLAVAAAADADVLTAVNAAKQAGIADAILVGDAEAIARICRKEGVNSESFEIEHEPDVRLAARRAAALVRGGSAQVLMKGLVGTADFMRAVLNKAEGLGTGAMLSILLSLKRRDING